MQSAPSEPELPDRVPQKRAAVTPDLPPFGPGAPDLPDTKAKQAQHDGAEKDTSAEGERPPAGPGNAKPQEPTG
ncbi:hypothetical protein ABZY31_24140 [Streptomyces sp. NPDC006529]|uniref:hypothetical protein n=1 Tax=Streptomyces sp. NPDC006529 TaxID=3157177 RepID=UPI0033A290A0